MSSQKFMFLLFFKSEMNLNNKSIAVFGDSHVQKLLLPPHIVILGKGGEKLENWRNYSDEMVGYDIIIIMLGGNDICSKFPFVPSPSDIKGVMNCMRELVTFVEDNNHKCFVCDIIPRLSNERGIHYTNSRLADKYKRRHIQLENAIKRQDFQDGVHLKCYKNISKLLMKKVAKLL